MYSYLDKMQVLKITPPHLWGGVRRSRTEGLNGRSVQRRPDRPRPDPQLAAHDLDARDVRDVDATLKLFSNRTEQQLARGGDTAAEHDPVDADQHHSVAHANPQVPPGVAERLLRPRIPRARGGHSSLRVRLARRGGDGTRSGERLEAAAIAAAAWRPVGDDRLMAELACGALVAEVETPIEDQPSAHPGAERDPQHRGRAAARAQAVLGEREGARVIDQVARRLDRTRHRVGDLHSVPIPGNVGYEPGDACGGVEDTGHADPDRLDAVDVAENGSCHLDQLPDHALLALACFGAQETCFDEAWFQLVAFDHGPLQVRPTHVQTEV